jgi:hypothetical protein
MCLFSFLSRSNLLEALKEWHSSMSKAGRVRAQEDVRIAHQLLTPHHHLSTTSGVKRIFQYPSGGVRQNQRLLLR